MVQQLVVDCPYTSAVANVTPFISRQSETRCWTKCDPIYFKAILNPAACEEATDNL